MKNSNACFRGFIASLGILGLISCGSGDSSISVLPSLDEFEQHDITDVAIDVLFVIDDSGSMSPAQTELRNNFQDFIEDFANKGFDFNIAVGRTSSYSGGNKSIDFYCGTGNCPADAVLASSSLSYSQIVNKFTDNADVGLGGTGAENGIQATKEILDNQTSGVSFPRPGAHLAVVHVGDENDNTSLGWNGFNTVGDYIADLESRGASGVSVHAIEVTGGPDCYYNSSSDKNGNYGGGSKGLHQDADPGTTYFDMASQADGLELSICEPFANSLAQLGDHISSLASAFPLSDILDHGGIDTLTVYVEGLNGNNPIPESSTNGYTYDQTNNAVVFHGSMVPPQGSTIGVTYTCTNLNCNNP